MIFPESLSGLTSSSLLTGGAIAMVVAGWHQVKSVFSYLSAFLVRTVRLDNTTSYAVLYELRGHWKLVPTGKTRVQVKQCRVSIGASVIEVPYELPDTTSIYYRGWDFVVVQYHGEYINLVSWRIGRDPRALISSALRSYSDRYNPSKDYKPSRFFVTDILGSDKSMSLSIGGNSGGSLNRNSPEQNDPKFKDNDFPTVYVEIDESFMYRREEYTPKLTTEDKETEVQYLQESCKRVISNLEVWLARKDWYIAKTIPHRAGVGFYGPPGTGKSTMSVIIGRRLGIPVYRFFLNTLSDVEFHSQIREVATPAIVLFEDLDNVFHGRVSVKNKFLSFDTVLNVMSGANNIDGIVFMVTVNDVTKLDPALGVLTEDGRVSTRPGRIDHMVFMGAMHDEAREKMVRNILSDWPELLDEGLDKTVGYTIAQVQEYCVQLAQEQISKEYV